MTAGPMFEQERRRTERLLFVPPIDARAQNLPVHLVDIGVLGTRVEHEQPLAAGGPQKLHFRWDGEEVEVDCTVVHSEFAGGRFSSGLSFTGIEPQSLRRVIDSLADREEMDRLRTLIEALNPT